MLDIIKTEKANKTLNCVFTRTTAIIAWNAIGGLGTIQGSKFNLNPCLKMILNTYTS